MKIAHYDDYTSMSNYDVIINSTVNENAMKKAQ